MAATTPTRSPEPTSAPPENGRPKNYWLMVLWLGCFLIIIVAALINYFSGWFVVPH